MNDQIKKEAIYEAEIKPLVTQVFDLCHMHEIAMISVFHLGSEDQVCVTSNLGEETDAPILLRLLGVIVTDKLDPSDVREAYMDSPNGVVKA